jgi:hypothetical protein
MGDRDGDGDEVAMERAGRTALGDWLGALSIVVTAAPCTCDTDSKPIEFDVMIVGEDDSA